MNTTDIAKEIVRNVSELVSDGKALPRDTVSITNSELRELVCLVLNTELPKWGPFVEQIADLATAIERDHPECHGLDTPDRVCFYEQEFYPLSNFSSFQIKRHGLRFPTSEHAYHWEKFPHSIELRQDILLAPSAHEALKMAEKYKNAIRSDWKEVRLDVMREIIRAKFDQHEYVRRKLMQTGTRELVENSWRDDFWGWGPNRDGQNMLGKLWMELRELERAKAGTP